MRRRNHHLKGTGWTRTRARRHKRLTRAGQIVKAKAYASANTWRDRMLKKINTEQQKIITAKFGKRAALDANYGWVQGRGTRSISLTTKVYVPPSFAALTTKVCYPSSRLQHRWEKAGWESPGKPPTRAALRRYGQNLF